MKLVDCEICMHLRCGKCTNPNEATFGVKMNTHKPVTCKGFTLYPLRESCVPIKKIRKVKGIYDFEMIKTRTIIIR